MCGIAGLVSSERALEPILFEMMKSLDHRGPDNSSSYTNKNVGLAHTRLSIIDLSEKSNQPLHDFSKRYVIVFNGEIYNYREIRAELETKGVVFRTEGDAEVLLNGFALYGNKIFKEIRGFYSVCIYDSYRETFTLARDYFGKKPLYFINTGKEFLFSSEIKTLLCSLSKKPEINYESLSHYLWKGYYANGDSAFSGINSLLAGQILKINLKNFQIIENFTESNKKIISNFTSSIRSIDTVEDALVESTSLRLVSDVPISFLLSGGIDSSLISKLASKKFNQPLKTYYVGYEDKQDIFEELAEYVAQNINSTHTSYKIKSINLEETLDKLVNVFDEPFGDYSAIPSLEIYKKISKNNKVAIAGDGADEIFAGYKDSRLFFLKSILPTLSLKSESLLDLFYKYFDSPHKFIRYSGYFASLFFMQGGNLSHTTSKGGWNNYYRSEYMTPEGYEVTGKNYCELEENKSFLNSGDNSFERYLNFELKRLTYDYLVKVDRCSMANSLEVRSPYIDRGLLKKLNPANTMGLTSFFETKKELKKILRKKGLNKITGVKKMGFTPPLDNWILEEKSYEVLHHMIDDKNSIINFLFDKKKLSKMIANKRNIVFNKTRLWNLMVLHTWHKKNY